MSDFSKQDDYIDSRDVISRIDELSDEIDELGGHELRPTATRDVWEVREDSDGEWTIVDGHHASEGDAREAYTEEQTTELEVLEALHCLTQHKEHRERLVEGWSPCLLHSRLCQ